MGKYGCEHREPYRHDSGTYYRCKRKGRGQDCIDSFADTYNCVELSKPVRTAGHKSKIINHAASLHRERYKLSEHAEDYPKRFPNHVLREIQKHNERLRLVACDLRSIADIL